jgi:hypothetical protein
LKSFLLNFANRREFDLLSIESRFDEHLLSSSCWEFATVIVNVAASVKLESGREDMPGSAGVSPAWIEKRRIEMYA